MKRVGHAGTLDPLATGVLPIAIGPATRLIEFGDELPKTYAARVRFGAATDTYDAEGSVTAVGDASWLSAAAIEAVLREFVGDIVQAPPAFSAIKVAGRPLYRYAREGAPVTATPRVVHIDGIELISFRPLIPDDSTAEAELVVRCGKGTYIRSLAHDLGAHLGCGAHLAELRRTASSGFRAEEAHTQDAIIAAASEGRLDELVLAADRIVEHRLAAIVSAEHARDIRSGRDILLPAEGPCAECRAYDVSGGFLGMIGRAGGRHGAAGAGTWHPLKVLPSA